LMVTMDERIHDDDDDDEDDPRTQTTPTRTRAFQFGQKKFLFDSILATESIFFDSIRFSNLINLPLVH